MEPAKNWAEYSERYTMLEKMRLAFIIHELQNLLGKISDGVISPDDVALYLDQSIAVMLDLEVSDTEYLQTLLKRG